MKQFFTPTLFRILFVFLPLLLLTNCGTSRRLVGIEEGWELLAERKVNFVRDKDEIPVRSRNRFTAIRFKVEDREVRLTDLKIYYENGDKLEPALDDVIGADQFSRIIELGREGRFIDKLEFRYRTTGNILKGRANVLVLGQRYDPYYRY
ncbi:MAG: hypothetical protein M3342_02675 [Bacteroidota bacterium]|nr:hypothetical protein [Flavisolibacter sp.]MDQ3842907.1 hypothetical protein [Bacteroidota bacterium]